MSLKLKNIFTFLSFSIMILMKTEAKTNANAFETDQFSRPFASGKGIGISAWGLVLLIVSLILLGVVVYYIAFLYPILCKKERKYNRIELTTV